MECFMDLWVKTDTLYHHKEFNDLFLDHIEEKTLSTNFNLPNNRIQILWNHILVLLFSFKNKTVVLSFDNFSFFLLFPFYFLTRNNLRFVIHNNLDLAMNNVFHRYVFKLLTRYFNLIILNKTLKKRLYNNFKHVKSISTVLHPPFYHKEIYPKLNNAFIHGRIKNINVIYENLEHFINYDHVFINNSKIKKPNKNFTVGYLDNFDSIIGSSTSFYFLDDYNYRCYGILHKLINMKNITIYIKDKDMFEEYSTISKNVKFFTSNE